ncbi:coiled-coil domain-containing protein-domain-containing protein [Mortierella sp. GBAus27b]|nr:hypothetical protein BGX31_007953 [Mortierella sp. GBA43]KAI8353425.1 coiled-coil domain-containing protein-domain-containing protein [Mortierella sp. GBAus27b]
MALTQTSIKEILAHLDPHLETLQTGFPTSTRPNEPALTKEQKRQKIEATLANDPGIFLTKWGSVILYPQSTPPVNPGVDSHTNGEDSSPVVGHSLAARDILDLFAPLTADYEVKYQLKRLYQQLQQLSEHAKFEESKRQPSDPSAVIPSINTPNTMEIEATNDSQFVGSGISPEDQKPDPSQDDLFARSIILEKTRRNRRLNYLLRHLAPPDPNQMSSSHSSGAKGKGSGAYATSRSSNYGAGDHRDSQNPQNHPALASILSISGSLSNLSFADSTYFSDAEMQARAPELYQQYIGRFMDNDDDDREDDDDETRNNDTDDQGRPRRQKQAPKTFGKDVGLVDRILWSVDHPNLNQQLSSSQERNRIPILAQTPQNRSDQQASRGQTSASFPLSQPMTQPLSDKQESSSEFEEEFDTESEDEETKMVVDNKTNTRNGTSKGDNPVDSSVASAPSNRVPGSLSSTTVTSSGMVLDEPEERTLFANIENVEPATDSDEDKEIDQETADRKEDQEALRQEFVLLMKQRFLDGLDRTFDYSTIDFDENLDDLEQENYDQEDEWFDNEDDEDDEDNEDRTDGQSHHPTHGAESSVGSQHTTRVASTIRARAGQTSRMAFDERLLAWESNEQNGSGEYDY